MEWGDQHRPVGRWIPRFILDHFDIAADWLDGEVATVHVYSSVPWSFKVERWDALNMIGMIVCPAIYSLWIGSWLYGMTIGPLMYLLWWMAVAWML